MRRDKLEREREIVMCFDFGGAGFAFYTFGGEMGAFYPTFTVSMCFYFFRRTYFIFLSQTKKNMHGMFRLAERGMGKRLRLDWCRGIFLCWQSQQKRDKREEYGSKC